MSLPPRCNRSHNRLSADVSHSLLQREFSLPLTRRPRRNRKSKAVREMLSETKLSVSDFVYPVFIMDGNNKEEAIPSMPGITRKTIDILLSELEEVVKLGILAIAPFPAIAEELKDSKATLSYAEDGLVQRAIRQIKEKNAPPGQQE